MKILHTADWHLGIELMSLSRQHEFEKIFAWMLELVKERGIDVILIAGDVYDRFVPANEAQKLYYDFLLQLRSAGVRQVVVISGNHDSGTGLSAPGELLHALSIEVFGSLDASSPTYDSHIVPLKNEDGSVAAVVCALPHLSTLPRPEYEEEAAAPRTQHEEYEDALCRRYHILHDRARELYPAVPLIGMGHLYMSPDGFHGYSQIVGNSPEMNSAKMPPFDYFALGHMHKGYPIAGHPTWLYSGSLFTTKFNELGEASRVLIIDTDKGMIPEAVEIPVFQAMKAVSGSREELLAILEAEKSRDCSVWLKITNTGAFWPNMLEEISAELQGSQAIPVFVENNFASQEQQQRRFDDSALADIRPEQVFDWMLQKLALEDETRDAYRRDLELLLHECMDEDGGEAEAAEEIAQ